MSVGGWVGGGGWGVGGGGVGGVGGGNIPDEVCHLLPKRRS